MFSRWPRYLSHGPAGEMWSVVHLPLAFMQHRQADEVLAVPRRERLEQLEAVGVGRHHDLDAASRRPAGRRSPVSPGSKPLAGQLLADGRARAAPRSPSALVSGVGDGVEVEPAGERQRDDRLGRGDERRACRPMPSLRFGKLRLNEVTIVFGVALLRRRRAATGRCTGRRRWRARWRRCASRSASRPSRSIVARTCSEPGVMSSGVLAPAGRAAAAWRAMRGGAGDVLVGRVGARADERGARSRAGQPSACGRGAELATPGGRGRGCGGR